MWDQLLSNTMHTGIPSSAISGECALRYNNTGAINEIIKKTIHRKAELRLKYFYFVGAYNEQNKEYE